HEHVHAIAIAAAKEQHAHSVAEVRSHTALRQKLAGTVATALQPMLNPSDQATATAANEHSLPWH
ncbi:MAG: hypothetical protein ACKPKO_43050, partial [Candidatus Fonsibacter sp.]